jgi:hypothetical protein
MLCLFGLSLSYSYGKTNHSCSVQVLIKVLYQLHDKMLLEMSIVGLDVRVVVFYITFNNI